MEKEWLQFDRRTPDYKKGARNFVNEARAREGSDVIICPCITCRNFLSQHFETAYEHLVIKGMYSQYDNWFCHGQSGSEPVHNEEVDISETYKMYKDCYLQHDEVIWDPLESKESEFANLVREAETPLFFGCTKYTKMSASVALLKMKARHCLTNVAFNDILEAVGGMLPEDNTLPDSLYSTKKLVKAFDLGYEKIHACVNDCCLFRKNLQHAEECPKCGTSRWKRNESSFEIQKGILAKVLRYFPIIPRLRRMFGVTEMAEQLRWHSNHK